MPAIATLALLISVLTATTGLYLFAAAWKCRDDVALILGRELARAGRWIGGAGLATWIIHGHQTNLDTRALLVAATAAVVASVVTKAKPPQAPRPA